jgi:hypothetical protein
MKHNSAKQIDHQDSLQLSAIKIQEDNLMASDLSSPFLVTSPGCPSTVFDDDISKLDLDNDPFSAHCLNLEDN